MMMVMIKLLVSDDGDDDDEASDDDGTTSYAPPPGSLPPNELSDVEEKARYLPIATFYKFHFGKSLFKIQNKRKAYKGILLTE